jgi:hypothetical protein
MGQSKYKLHRLHIAKRLRVTRQSIYQIRSPWMPFSVYALIMSSMHVWLNFFVQTQQNERITSRRRSSMNVLRKHDFTNRGL